jgi:transglutaminase-like putative cysteine protease
MVWGILYNVECVKDYKSKHQMDLRMSVGDVIEVYGIESNDWVCGKNTINGEFGSFPLNITRQIEDLQPPVPNIDYVRADAHARNASPRDEESVRSLSQYLQSVSSIKEMQLRSVFVWICDHISYDFPSFSSGNVPSQDAHTVLRTRMSVCQGYAELFVALGPGVELVSGYGKGISIT